MINDKPVTQDAQSIPSTEVLCEQAGTQSRLAGRLSCDPARGSQSFLSQYVADILQCSVTGDIIGCFTPCHTLDWKQLSALIKDIDANSDNYCVKCVAVLAPVFNSIHNKLDHMSVDDFDQLYSDTLLWTGQVEIFKNCFKMLKNDQINEALLLMTSLLERSLGDVYLIRGTQCPSMLKDLLVSEELRGILGENVMQFLRTLIGPPRSLNLRNIFWHGFVAPGQVHRRLGYTLLLTIISIGTHLTEGNVTFIARRELIDYTNVASHFTTVPDLGVMPSLLVLDELFSKEDHLIPVQMKSIWRDILMEYRSQRYGHAIVLLLPQLECVLRLMYVQVNNCPHRLCTAMSSELYTTFDEILADRTTEGTTNILSQTLGNSCMNVLNDLLLYPEGPRLRDHISHGEVDLTSVPRQVVACLLSLTTALCVMCLPHGDHVLSVISKTGVLQEIECYMLHYESMYHPVSLLRTQIEALSVVLSRWRSAPRPDDMLWSQWNDIDTNDPDTTRFTSVISSIHSPDIDTDTLQLLIKPFEDISLVVREMLNTRPMAHQYRRDVMCLLRQVTSQSLRVTESVEKWMNVRYEQFKKCKLRSRQRNNYKKMIDCVPRLSMGLRLVLVTVLVTPIDDVVCHRELELIRYLKFTLQYVEKLETFTSMEKNRWEEATQKTFVFLDKTRNYYL